MANLIGIAEYAKMVNRPTTTIRYLCRNKRIPGAVKYGTEWLINLSLVKNVVFLDRGRPMGAKTKNRTEKVKP